jgi:hypothetical protein
MCLESKQKLHRDVSYTNILLRDPGVDSAAKMEVRKQLTERLGLSDIEKLRKELNCREGLLIDFDYGADATTQVEQDMNQASQSIEEESRGSHVMPTASATTPNDCNHAPSGARTVRFSTTIPSP